MVITPIVKETLQFLACACVFIDRSVFFEVSFSPCQMLSVTRRPGGTRQLIIKMYLQEHMTALHGVTRGPRGTGQVIIKIFKNK